MKKYFIILSILFISSSLVAQNTKLGLRVSSTISANRIKVTSDTLSIANNNTAVKFMVGVVADYEFDKNYFFSTGLNYFPKKVSFIANGKNDVALPEEVYTLQYLQIPLSLKLVSNEVSLDKKLFFIVGAELDFKIKENSNNAPNNFIKRFKKINAGLVLGGGMEQRIAVNTYIYLGASYHRALSNSATTFNNKPDFRVKSDFFAIDFFVRF